MIKVKAVICPECLYTIFSRARHDFRLCKCGIVAIDGGFDYVKISCPPSIVVKCTELNLRVSKQVLYDDWQYQINKYGLIAPKKRKK